MSQLRNQNGLAGVIEILLVVVVVGVVGFTAYNVYTHKKATNDAAMSTKVPSVSPAPAAAGEAVKVVEDEAVNEASSAAGLDEAVTDVEASDGAAANVSGGVNEKSF